MKKRVKKIVTIVGARPQFIKAAVVSRALRGKFDEVLVHTGQHYDANMSAIFFKELDIPRPDYSLGVGSGSHGKQTAAMLVGIEGVLVRERPDCLLVYGDTNSTLAGALAAAKLHIPIAHVEAGLRSFNKQMPEEQNRVLTDHLSETLFCPTDRAVECLGREGIVEGVHQVGDVMCDATLLYAGQEATKEKEAFIQKLSVWNGEAETLMAGWYLATIHRAENTDSQKKVGEIMDALEGLDAPALFPVHPRVRGIVEVLCRERKYRNIVCVEPVGYKGMLGLTQNAKKVVTDSGGLQKEAYILRTPCVTVRDQTEWTETLEGGHNILAKPEKYDIMEKVLGTRQGQGPHPDYYGDGHAAERICKVLGGW